MKLVLLSSLVLAEEEKLISEDRLLFKISDRVVSLEDVGYFDRNLLALKCLYPDSLTYRYFGDEFVKGMSSFGQSDFPSQLKSNEKLKKQLLSFFKLMKYSDSQRLNLSKDLVTLVKDSIKMNNCKTDVLFKGELRASFKSILSLELYLKSRYGNIKTEKNTFLELKESLDLLLESIDKQYQHEFYF